VFTALNDIYAAVDSGSFVRQIWTRAIEFSLWGMLKNAVQLKLSNYRSGQALTAPGRWGSQNFQTIGTWRWKGCQSYAPTAFTIRKLLKGAVRGNNPRNDDDPKRSIQNAVLAFHQQNFNVQWVYLSRVPCTRICKPKQTIYAVSEKPNINCNPNSGKLE